MHWKVLIKWLFCYLVILSMLGCSNQGVNRHSEPLDSIGMSISTKEMNAYEFIIGVMQEPQLWNASQRPPYNLLWEQNKADERLVDGTGWNLIDEEDAVFSRGYQGTLTLSFSKNEAISELDSQYSYTGDYLKHTFNYGTETYTVTYDEMDHLYSTTLTYEEYKQQVYPRYNMLWYIKDMMIRYEEQFESVGCPLLGKPKGTLTSYMNKTITILIQPQDEYIHYIWTQDDFMWDWSKLDLNQWLADYRDILYQSVEPSECIQLMRDGTMISVNVYSPLYLVFVDPNISLKYIVYDENKTELWENMSFYGNAIGAIATYFLASAMREIYGYDGVFFFDVKGIPTSGERIRFGMSKDEFLHKASIPEINGLDENRQEIVTIYKEGELTVCNVDRMDATWSHFYDLFEDVMSVSSYHNHPCSFAPDWMLNTHIYFGIAIQRELGLR